MNLGLPNLGAMNSSCGCCAPAAGAGFPMQGGFETQQQMMMAQMSQMMMMLQTMLQQMLGSAGGGSGLAPTGASFGGASPSGGGSGVDGFLGGSSGTGAASGVAPGTGEKGTGQAAVDLARKYLGRDSISLKGDMPHFTAAGGVTNNCVDFVSSALESQGLVKGHHINVRAFEKELQKQGWVQVPANQAKPGDVWINHSRGHTELVATAGATKLIGSNGSARQKVSEHANNPSSGVIYQKR